MEVQHWGRSQKPWKRADASLEDTERVKFVTKERLIRWIEYLLKHLYVQIGDKVMKQVVGIPMGTSCSPFLANLTLFMFEFEWFAQQISTLRMIYGIRWSLKGSSQKSQLTCTRSGYNLEHLSSKERKSTT